MRILLVVLVAISLSACGKLSAPVLAPFADEAHWVLLESYEYELGDTGLVITVPQGFVTDGASIPRMFCQVLPEHGLYGRAAVVHDYLYWSQRCTKEQADNLMLMAMIESGVRKGKRWAIYQGVTKGGMRSWKSNRRDRLAGVPRIIPGASNDPEFLQEVGNSTWDEYQDKLIKSGVRDTVNDDGSYCKIGDRVSMAQRPRRPTQPIEWTSKAAAHRQQR